MPVFREAACGKALAALWPPVTAPPAVGGKSGYFPGCCASHLPPVERVGAEAENPVISDSPVQGKKPGPSLREKQVFPVISRRAVYRKTLAKFGAFPVKNFCCNSSGPMPARPCSPFGLIHIPEEQPYDTLIPDFRESRESSERAFLCRRVSLAFACEIISNHDSVNCD